MEAAGKTVSAYIGELIGDVIGWIFCMAMVAGFYALGFWLAPHFGGSEHRDTFGLLAVIATIWMYEHQVAHSRWGKLQERG
jgi:hypothetical protein